MILNHECSPVILEVMTKSDVNSFDAFKAMVKACRISMNGPVLEYKTIYGEQLTFDTSTREVPTINGHPVNSQQEAISFAKNNSERYSVWEVEVLRLGRIETIVYHSPQD